MANQEYGELAHWGLVDDERDQEAPTTACDCRKCGEEATHYIDSETVRRRIMEMMIDGFRRFRGRA